MAPQMSSTSTTHDGLARVLAANPDRKDQLRARSALMWLCVAKKPLRTHELWIALLVEESSSVEDAETLVTEEQGVDDRKARAVLSGLLLDLIHIVEDGDANELRVTLSDGLKESLLKGQGPAELAFKAEDAHLLVASVSMVAISTTTLHLAHIHDQSTPSGLVLYAWTYWSHHLRLSRYTLTHAHVARVFDSMVRRVCTDALVFLLMMSNFITGLLELPAHYNETELRLCSVAAVRRAQVALPRPIGILARLVAADGCAELLQDGREKIDASSFVGDVVETPYLTRKKARMAARRLATERSKSSGSQRNSSEGSQTEVEDETEVEEESESQDEEDDLLWPALEDPKDLADITNIRSRVELLRVDRTLRKTISLFNDDERQMVHAYAELARGLRLTAVFFARTHIYEGLLDECPGCWSPMNVLYHVAAWAEAIAGYPYWERVPGNWPSTSWLISDRKDENIETSHAVLEKIRMLDRPYHPRRGCVRYSNAMARPSGISFLRWHAALILNDIQGFLYVAFRQPVSRLLDRKDKFIINDVRFLRTRQTSFSKLPPSMHNSTRQLTSLRPLLPASLLRLYRARLGPFFARTRFFQSLDDFSSGAFTAGMTELWPSAKAAILKDGYRRAFAYFGVAILANHIRRMLVPWLGLYMYYTPLADLKLAAGSPAVFIDEVLSFSWRYAAFMTLQKTGTEMLGLIAIGVLNMDAALPRDAPRKQRSLLGQNARNMPPSSLPTPILDMAKVGYLVWTFTNAEYIFARSASTIAILLAYTKLIVFGTPDSHLALGHAMQAHWTKLPLHLWQLGFYLSHGLFPVVSGALVSACAGQAALLLVVSGVAAMTAYVARYSNKYYIVLELSGLVLVLAMAVLVAGVLGLEFCADPLDLRGSGSGLRRFAARARTVLPTGAGSRMEILKRRKATAGVEGDVRADEVRRRTVKSS